MSRLLLLAISLLLFCGHAYAQTDTQPTTPQGDSLTVTSTEPVVTSEEGFTMAKSPLGAALRSAIIPGWGQYYTESYWKVPLVLGATGALIWGYFYEHDKYANYRDLYDANIDLENPAVNLTNTKIYREYHRNRRDTYAWWFGVVYLLQIADAVAGAHMYDFDVSDEVNVNVAVNPMGGLNLQIRW